MNTKNELFYHDAYCREFDAAVVSCTETAHGFEIILDQTAFYPEGGGQPGDQGTLNGTPVLDTRRAKDAIVHYCREPLTAGQSVHGIIDWNRRFDLMQQHSGEHMFSGIIHQLYGCDNIGFHLGEETITLDFNGLLSWEKLTEAENLANEIIWQNVPVEISFPSKEELAVLDYRSKKELEGDVRIVTIPGADVCACCGTHVKTTGEIGLIKILSSARRKDGTRMEIVCGRRALHYVQRVTDENLKISHLLSAKVFETSQAVSNLQNELKERTFHLRGIIMNQLEEKLNEAKSGAPVHLIFTEGVDTQELRKLCNRLIDEKQVRIAGAFSLSDNQYRYVLISSTKGLRELSTQLNQSFDGKGGGNDTMIQGSLTGEESAIRSLVESFAVEGI